MASLWPHHIIPYFELSKFLPQKGHKVSFISTRKNIHGRPKLAPTLSPLINLVELPLPYIDGLPQAAESTSELSSHQVPYLKKAYDMLEPHLTQFLQNSDVTLTGLSMILFLTGYHKS
uniref:Uncharacterized protein n=1 Tax=Quercus lobata TaxID=97700 RepID=A0A7N2KX84_QUELO